MAVFEVKHSGAAAGNAHIACHAAKRRKAEARLLTCHGTLCCIAGENSRRFGCGIFNSQVVDNMS